MIKKMFLALFALGIFTTSCSNDDDNAPANANLTIDLNGLEALGSDYVYEGWIIVNGVPVSTGTFSSVAFPQVFSVEADQLSSATRFVLSIEPSNDPNPAPADTKLLVGDFVGNSASVNTDIVGDFSSAAGAFFLRTPTDETGTNNGNDENGVWFGTPGMPPTPNFVLPTLPAGWAYEGWVVGDNGPITTGTFNAFNTADVFDDFSETSQAGPPVPGEDFFLIAKGAGESSGIGSTEITTVLPLTSKGNVSPAGAFKPLVGTAGQDTAPATYNFGQNLTSLPWGEVNR